MIIEFADNQGRLGKVRGSAILAVLRSTAFIESKIHTNGGYFPAILLLEGGHRVETNTDFEAIIRAWRS